jgi:Ca2+-transporting ATPase
LGTGWLYWKEGRPEWQTMVFSTVCFSQLFHVMAIRSGRISVFRAGIFSNRPLLAAVLLSSVLLFAVIYAPFLSESFKTVPLAAVDFAVSFVLGSVIFWAVEFEKWNSRRKAERVDR